MAHRLGLEIEFHGNLETVLNALRATGLPVVDARHTHSTGVAPSGWAVKRDGSVNNGGEITSPPFDFDLPESREAVRTVIDTLRDNGCTVSDQTGIHIHMEGRNEDGTKFTAKQVAAVVRFNYKFEDAIYRLAGSGWENGIRAGSRTYAKPIPEAIARKIMRARTHDEMLAIWTGSGTFSQEMDRYFCVNLHPFYGLGYTPRRRTIELRYFNGSLNADRVLTYLALAAAMQEDARLGHSRSVTKSYRVGGMVAGTTNETSLLMRLQQVLTTESRDTSRLMSREDWKWLRKFWTLDSIPCRNIWARGW